MLKRVILTGFILLGVLSAQTENLVRNGSFEQGLNEAGIPKYWGETPYNQMLSSEAVEGKHSLRISSLDIGYHIGAQIISVDLEQTTRMAMLGYIKGENIEAAGERWQGAKAQVIFMDQAFQEIAPPLDIILARTDSFNWDMFIQNIDVPAETRKIKVLLGLWGASGTVWYDDIRLYPITQEGETREKSRNLLDNGDFEIWGTWELLGEGEIKIDGPGYFNSAQALYIKNEKPVWTFAAQSVSLKELQSRRLTLSGVLKCQNIVPGRKRWQKGRVYAEFYDAQNKMVGEWKEILSVERSTDWINFLRRIDIPQYAETLRLYFGIQEATGEIAFDDLILIEG